MAKRVISLISLLLLILLIQTANAVEVSVSTIPQDPHPGDFIVRVTVTAENPIYSARLYVSGLVSKSISLGDFSGQNTVDVPVSVSKAGIYEISVKLSYVEYENNTAKSRHIDGIFAILVSEKPQFEILNVSGSIRPGENGTISVEVVNRGAVAKNVRINFSGVTAKKPGRFYEEWGKEAKTLTFFVYAERSEEVGEKSVGLNIECRDEFGNEYSFNLPFSVTIEGRPELAISEFKTTPERIYPDTELTLNLAIENIGDDSAENVKVELILPEGFEGDSIAHLGEIKRGGEKSVNFELKTGNITGKQNIGIRIASDEGVWFENATLFIFPLEEIHIGIAGVYTIPKRVVEHGQITLNIAVENSGKQEAKAVRIKLILPEGFEGRDTYFIGSLESGDSATSTFELKAGKAGRYNITAEITYLDSALQRHTATEHFTIYVFPAESKLPFLAAIVLLVAAVIAYRLRKLKRSER